MEKQFRNSLARAIEASGLTTTEVARYLNTQYVTVYRWLQGINTPKPHHQRLILLAMDHYECQKEPNGSP